MQEGSWSCVGVQNTNWEHDTSRNTIHPQNISEINVESKKEYALSSFVTIFVLVCFVVGSYYKINPFIICSGCAVVRLPLFCQIKRKEEDRLAKGSHFEKSRPFRNCVRRQICVRSIMYPCRKHMEKYYKFY